MIDLAYKIIFLIFTIYALIHSISYGLYEINNEKNMYGGSMVIFFSIFSIVFSNIIIWME